MLRKPGFPVANCNIKMPDNSAMPEPGPGEEDAEQMQRRQQLINFGHAQWGFNNWSWSVTKQELDFVDFTNGKYCAGVVAFVSVTVKSLDIHRENIGYATTAAAGKGAAIYRARKCAVTNALRETLLSFGGNVANQLLELIDTHKSELSTPAPEIENNQNAPNKPTEPKNSPLNKNIRKDTNNSQDNAAIRTLSAVKNAVAPPVAAALPMPANLPPPRPLPAPAPRAPPPAPPAPPAPPLRHNSNEGRPLESMSEEEARAERKRRQQRAQEEFRQKQLMAKHKQGNDERQELQRSSFDRLLMDIPTQDIEIEHTGEAGSSPRSRSPHPETSAKRRASFISRLDIVTD